MLAQVVLGRVSSEIDRHYTYTVPLALEGKLEIGHRVLIPFGRGKRYGYVVSLRGDESVANLKSILTISPDFPVFPVSAIEKAAWLSHMTFSFFGTTLKHFVHPRYR